MPLILSGNVATATAAVGYDVANSCRFNDDDSASMSRDQSASSAGTTTKGTLSVWIKMSAAGTEQVIYERQTDTSNYFKVWFENDLLCIQTATSGSVAMRKFTTRLFRDPGAWMNIVVRIDSTDGTAEDRQQIWINGVRETSFGTSTTATEDASQQINTGTGTDYIGKRSSGNYFDGYMAELVWIDGTSYAATSFGEFNSDSPNIWQPIDVSELTFGTNGFYCDFETDGTNTAFVDSSSNARVVTVAGDVNHSFVQSKFDGSSIYLDGGGDKLTMPDSSDWDFGTGSFTWEAWIYKPHTAKESIFETRTSGSNNGFNLEFSSAHKLEWYDESISGTLPVDPNAITANTWTHYACVRNGTTFTMYRDGTSVGTPLTGDSSSMSSAGLAIIGINAAGTASTAFEGYFDDMRLSSVARYTANFSVPTAAFTSDSDTVFLIQSKASNLLGGDKSGVGNHLTTVNLDATDSATDSPTNNFATINTLAIDPDSTFAFSEGNLQYATSSSTRGYWVSTIGVSTGKWYFEYKATNNQSRTDVGIAGAPAKANDDPESTDAHDNVTVYRTIGGDIHYNSGNGDDNYYNTATGDDDIIIGCALDLTSGTNTIAFSIDGAWVTGDGTTSTDFANVLLNDDFTNVASTINGVYHFIAGDDGGDQDIDGQVNFGNPVHSISSGNADGNGYGNFEYAVPSGYYALCTKNLAEFG